MLNLSTARDTFKYLVQTYGPLFTAGATIIAATVASFAARAAMRSARASEKKCRIIENIYGAWQSCIYKRKEHDVRSQFSSGDKPSCTCSLRKCRENSSSLLQTCNSTSVCRCEVRA